MAPGIIRSIALTLFAFALQVVAGARPVVFSINAPEAESVLLAGEFNDWTPLPMTRSEDGQWTTRVGLEPGDYAYKFIVDDVWLFDPANDARKEVNGVLNSKRTVGPTGPTDASASNAAAAEVNLGPRDWKDSLTGNTIEARLVDVDGVFAVLEVNGQQFSIRKERLRPVDRAYMEAWQAATEGSRLAEAESGTPAGSGGPFDPALAPRKMHVFTLPMRHRLRAYATNMENYDPKSDPQNMRVAIALPEGFDPSAGPHRVAIINSTVDGDASSVNGMREYYRAVTDAGWICLAVDVEGDETKRKNVWSTTVHRFFRTKYFISWGIRDEIATAEVAQRARTWAEDNFREHRFRTFDGGHVIHQPHLEEALRWFSE